MKKVTGVEILADETHGQGGFLVVRRFRLRNRREDGTLSEPYVCDFATRPRGVDAVAVVVYRRNHERVEVLLREGLRPALHLGRDGGHVPLPEDSAPLALWEVVAGIIEPHDVGEDGIRARAVEEVWEEAGYRVEPAQVARLGSAFFLSPGAMCERVYPTCVEIAAGAEQHALVGDGSPMEEGAATRWLALDEAIAECTRGTVQDVKSEVLLRRLLDQLREAR